jgi:hypothetical protein
MALLAYRRAMRFGFPLESTRTSFAIRAILYRVLTSPTVVLQLFLVRLVEAVQEGLEFSFVETQVDNEPAGFILLCIRTPKWRLWTNWTLRRMPFGGTAK